jgi:hypothetical protein
VPRGASLRSQSKSGDPRAASRVRLGCKRAPRVPGRLARVAGSFGVQTSSARPGTARARRRVVWGANELRASRDGSRASQGRLGCKRAPRVRGPPRGVAGSFGVQTSSARPGTARARRRIVWGANELRASGSRPGASRPTMSPCDGEGSLVALEEAAQWGKMRRLGHVDSSGAGRWTREMGVQ